MVQPWFRGFTRAVEPASPRFHPCFSQVPLRHGPRVFWGRPCRTACGHWVRDKVPIPLPSQRHKQQQHLLLPTWPTSSR